MQIKLLSHLLLSNKTKNSFAVASLQIVSLILVMRDFDYEETLQIAPEGL